MPNVRTNRRGTQLISLMVVSMLTTVSALLVQNMLRGGTTGMRRLAATQDLGEIRNLFHLLTDSPGACQKSGLIGQNISSLLSPSPHPVSITMSWPTSSGSATPVLQAGLTYNTTWQIDTFLMTDAVQTDPGRYLASFQLNAHRLPATAAAVNHRDTYRLKITTNAAGAITGCSGTETVPSCPNGAFFKGLSAAGSAICEYRFLYTVMYQEKNRDYYDFISGAGPLSTQNAKLTCYGGGSECPWSSPGNLISDLNLGSLDYPCQFKRDYTAGFAGWNASTTVFHAFADNSCSYYHTAGDGTYYDAATYPLRQCGFFAMECRITN